MGERPAPVVDLVEAARQGREAGFAGLHGRFAPQGELLLEACVPDLDEDARADVLQETFVRLFRRLDQLRDPAGFGQWFRKALLHEAAGRLRLRAHRQELLDCFGQDLAMHDPEDLARRLLAVRVVREVIEATADECTREVARGFYTEGQSRQAIAWRLQITEDVVRTRLHRFRRGVRRELLRRAVRLTRWEDP